MGGRLDFGRNQKFIFQNIEKLFSCLKTSDPKIRDTWPKSDLKMYCILPRVGHSFFNMLLGVGHSFFNRHTGVGHTFLDMSPFLKLRPPGHVKNDRSLSMG